jgi:hypothetical protein
MMRQEMIAVAHHGLLLGPAPLLAHNPVGRRAEREGVVLNYWGPHGPAVNKVTVVGPAPPLARIVELANDFLVLTRVATPSCSRRTRGTR